MKDLCVIYSKDDFLSRKPNMYYAGHYGKWVDDIDCARFVSVSGAKRLLSKWESDFRYSGKFNKDNYDIIRVEVKQLGVVK